MNTINFSNETISASSKKAQFVYSDTGIMVVGECIADENNVLDEVKGYIILQGINVGSIEGKKTSGAMMYSTTDMTPSALGALAVHLSGMEDKLDINNYKKDNIGSNVVAE